MRPTDVGLCLSYLTGEEKARQLLMYESKKVRLIKGGPHSQLQLLKGHVSVCSGGMPKGQTDLSRNSTNTVRCAGPKKEARERPEKGASLTPRVRNEDKKDSQEKSGQLHTVFRPRGVGHKPLPLLPGCWPLWGKKPRCYAGK